MHEINVRGSKYLNVVGAWELAEGEAAVLGRILAFGDYNDVVQFICVSFCLSR
jgi:hypothetical protein